MEWNPKHFKILGVWFTNDLRGCDKFNYKEKLNDIKKMTDAWLKRNITPLGRIAILKSLILSKLIHLWLLLPNPPGDFIDKLQKICYAFVWGDKKDKISRKVVHQRIAQGGLDVPNLNIFIQALKLKWIKLYSTSSHKWKNLAIHNYPFIENLHAFGPSICEENHAQNPFWVEVFDAYKKLFYKIKPTIAEEILAEPICYNERIKVGKSVIKQKQWINRGIYCVGHFIKENGIFMTHEEFMSKYDININFLTYYGITNAMKVYIMKSNIKIENNRTNKKNLCTEKISLNVKGCKHIYDILMSENIKPNCCDKWDNKINCNTDWKMCFYNVKKINDVTLRWFQLRIIHRIIGTKIILKQMGLTNSENCNYCGNIKENIEHIFWDCSVSQTFWGSFTRMIKERCNHAHNLKITKSLAILGVDNNVKIDHVFYFILILAKKYMYKCRYGNIQPEITAFKNVLTSRYKIEKLNSILNN